MFIYEVNILVGKSIEQEFKLWLKAHISEMEKVKGIKKGTIVYSNPENPLELSVHYNFDSFTSFQEYESGAAKVMRAELSSVLKSNIKIHRRALESVEL